MLEFHWHLGGARVGGGETGVEPSFPGPAALAQPSSIFLEVLFLTQSDGRCHFRQGF